MKKTDLEKLKALKLDANLKGARVPARFGEGSAGVPDKREQRRLDQAAGLIPFATKLNSELVAQLHRLAEERKVPLNELVGALLTQSLAAQTPTD